MRYSRLNLIRVNWIPRLHCNTLIDKKITNIRKDASLNNRLDDIREMKDLRSFNPHLKSQIIL